jgi:hypothetical protein
MLKRNLYALNNLGINLANLPTTNIKKLPHIPKFISTYFAFAARGIVAAADQREAVPSGREATAQV